MDPIEQLHRFTSHVRIAHHIPGRIRLKLVADLDQEQRQIIEDARRFGWVLDNIDGIRSVNINILARSCTVEYDPKVIPTQGWPDLLSGVRSPAAQVLTDIIEKKYRELAGEKP